MKRAAWPENPSLSLLLERAAFELGGFQRTGASLVLFRLQRGWSARGSEPPPVPDAAPPLTKKPRSEREPSDTEPAKVKKVVSIKWQEEKAWCTEEVQFEGTTENYGADEVLEVTITGSAGAAVAKQQVKVNGQRFSGKWKVLDVLPTRSGAKYLLHTELVVTGGGQKSPKPLAVHFFPDVRKADHLSGRDHFSLLADAYMVEIGSDIKFMQGWGGEVVKLGNRVPAGTGGLLDGQLAWAGYRWMKTVGVKKQFWDGAAWKDLPRGFVLADVNNFAVGFYKNSASYTCQYGGNWPEAMTDWNIDAPDKKQRVDAWKANIETTWTGKFDLHRKECKSTKKACCRYKTKASVRFVKQAAFSPGMMIVADGNIRSNDSLMFLGEPRLAVAAHEFGHHLGNPDEYAGAAVDATLNSDGAVNGIDADSMMGQNLTKVKARHYRTICKVYADMVRAEHGKSYTYEAVPP